MVVRMLAQELMARVDIHREVRWSLAAAAE